MPDEAQQPLQPDFSEVVEAYSNVATVSMNPWDASITFGLLAVQPGDPHKMQTRVRMPLTLAKVLAVILLRNARALENRTKVDIDLPDEMLQELGIAKEDWDRFKGLDS